MGNLKLNLFTKDGKELQPKKLDLNDPEVKLLIEESIKAQEKRIESYQCSRWIWYKCKREI